MKIKWDIKKLVPLCQKRLLDRYRACASVFCMHIYFNKKGKIKLNFVE
jgi:hypothetical protein